jgi:hypothetical protein
VATGARSGRSQPWAGLLAIAVAGGAVALFFLAIYPIKHYLMPVGYDTPRYLDQVGFVAERGLAHVPTQLPPLSNTLPSRPAFPVLVLTLGRLLSASHFTMAAVVPIVSAVALALAAAALLAWTLRLSPWECAAVAVIVGTSLVMVRLMAPETYTDNLAAGGLFMVSLVCLEAYVRNGIGAFGAILLIAEGGFIHGPTFLEMLAVLLVVAALYARGSWRAVRRGEAGLLSTPTGRVTAVAAGGSALALAAIFGLLGTAPNTPSLTRVELRKKLREDLPLYWFPLTLPLAAIGAASLRVKSQREGTSNTGFLLRLVGAWTAVTLAGVLAFLLGRNSPAHRFLAFFLVLPLMLAVGLLVLRKAAAARAGRVAGALVLLAGMLGLALLSAHELYRTLPSERGIEWLDQGKVHDALSAGAYLDASGVPDSAPVVFVIDDTGPNPLSFVPEETYMLRAVLRPTRVEHSWFYVGDPDLFLAGQPTFRDEPLGYNENEDRFWPAVRDILPSHPVALLLSSFAPRYAEVASAHPDWVVAPNVIALGGSEPTVAVAVPPVPRVPPFARTAALLVLSLGVLALVGVGWVVGLAPAGVRPFEILALSPAVGIGFLVATGAVADRLGVRLGGAGGPLAILAATAIGLGLAFRRIHLNSSSAA